MLTIRIVVAPLMLAAWPAAADVTGPATVIDGDTLCENSLGSFIAQLYGRCPPTSLPANVPRRKRARWISYRATDDPDDPLWISGLPLSDS